MSDMLKPKSEPVASNGLSMSAEAFTYWLQGFAELNPQLPTPEQWEKIKAHLSGTFSYGPMGRKW